MSDIESFREELQSLISKFEKDKNYYLSKGYPEAQVRIDFINPFFESLGWDIENKSQKPPHERDVIVELSPETTKRPDYNFRINGITKFFVEAKPPSVVLDDVNHILQAKSYAWSTKEVYFVVLTDFEEFRLYDASLKPNPRFPNEGLIFELRYTDYLDSIERLWELSKEKVEQGSLELLLPRDTKSKRLRIPPDKSFLEDLTEWRTELAKDIHKRNPEFDVKLLNDVVQKLLDRIIFIRIAEDRKIRPDRELWEIAAQWKEESRRKPIMTHLVELFHQVNDDLNGDIFKRHACEIAVADSNLLADIIESLYFPKSRYRFDAIGVELLGSIYERYLGSTIRVTPQRIKVEEKPEVRKAGGVYYTPKYIVDYIVKNTVGKIIEGKTPRQIEKIKILDPACGSGSFLLGAYQYLIDYHLKYYRDHPKEAQTLHLFPYWKMSPEEFTLPIHEKAKILRNNIFGIDIDPQAVEITMMSLYLKALEGERGLLPKKQHLLPPLSNNIKCGNSLIGYDIFDGLFSPVIPASGARRESFPKKDSGQAGMTEKEKWDEETKSRINPFDWNSKSTGFGEIMENGGFDVIIGNPPYGGLLSKDEMAYFLRNYKLQEYQLDTYLLFIEKSLALLKEKGLLGMIIPNTWLLNLQSTRIRQYIFSQTQIEDIMHYRRQVFGKATVDTEIVIFKNGKPTKNRGIKITIVQKDDSSNSYTIPQARWQAGNGKPINLFERPEIKELADKLRRFKVLDDLCIITQGAKPFQVGKGKPAQTRKIVDTKPYVSETQKDSSFRPLLRGNLIQRYQILWDDNYWISFGDWLAEPRYSAQYNAPDKIVIRQTGDSLVATLDREQFIVRDNLYTIVPRENKLDLRYILSLLNSRLLNWFYQTIINPEKGEALAQVKRGHLAQLPIALPNFNNPFEKAIHDKLVSLVDRMLELHKKKASLPPSAEREKIEREIAVTDEKIDEIVYGLYGITEEEKRIVEKEIQ
jgi:adenine-specific DNA-methyltransferase